jgi:hypothetical protein
MQVGHFAFNLAEIEDELPEPLRRNGIAPLGFLYCRVIPDIGWTGDG